MKSIDARVTGLVQGVFFRLSTRNRAIELGVRGTVRNEADGSVFVEAEGDPPVMTTFVAWLKEGPANARVDRVVVDERAPRGFKRFEVVD